MTTIIAGRFIREDAAAAAIARLVQSGFDRDGITSFFVNPAGQHDQYPIGGDEDASPGTEKAGSGAMTGAIGGGGVGVAVGLATLPILGPVAPLAGAAVGAYVGSLVGALDHLEPGKAGAETIVPEGVAAPPEPRKSGMLVAVAASEFSQQVSAIDVFRSAGAADIEHAEGNIDAGEWTDFDPVAPVVREG